MLTDHNRRAKHAEAGRQTVRSQFTDERMARDMLSIFEGVRR
jgi:hypothetical protein